MKSITAEEMYDNILREVYDEQVSLRLDERQQRLLAAKLARAFGHGGIVKVAEVSGITRQAVARGITELEVDDHPALENGRIRKPGGGRKKLIEQHPNLLDCLERILDGSTYGDPGRILFHTSISTYKAEKLLQEQYGISVSRYTIATLMGQLGYSRQVNQKTFKWARLTLIATNSSNSSMTRLRISLPQVILSSPWTARKRRTLAISRIWAVNTAARKIHAMCWIMTSRWRSLAKSLLTASIR